MKIFHRKIYKNELEFTNNEDDQQCLKKFNTFKTEIKNVSKFITN